MADFKGGRGKRVGYETQMYRIPTPLRPTIEALGLQFRLLWDGLCDPRGKKLISRIEAAIPDPEQLGESDALNLISDKTDGDIPDIKNELAELRSRLAEAKEDADKSQKLAADYYQQLQENLERSDLWREKAEERDRDFPLMCQRIRALEEENARLQSELASAPDQPQPQPVRPEAIAILQKAITPEKEGGIFKSNRATPLREAIQKALELLSGN